MSTPPLKRARLTNGSSYNENPQSGRSDHERYARRRSRSRDKWRERGRDRDDYRTRDVDHGRIRRRERSSSRDRHRSRRDPGQERSRSPIRDRGGRVRSPHRSSRSERSRERRGTPDRYDRNRDSRRKGSPLARAGRADGKKDQQTSKSEKRSSNIVMNGLDKDGEHDDDDDDEEAAMAKVMGFSNFRSTKNTKVPGNDKNYGIRKGQMAVYRQYMNRIGGFNRPLSPS